MRKLGLKNLSDSEKKDFIVNLSKEYFDKNQKPPSMTYLSSKGVSRKNIINIFCNLRGLYSYCEIPFFRRSSKISQNSSEMKEYIESIKIVDPNTKCWTTDKLSLPPDGRIRINYKGKTSLIYRVVYELWNGKLNSKLGILHEPCDNPGCFFPEHLVLGTAKDNAKSRELRGRGNHKNKKPIKRNNIKNIYDYDNLLKHIKSLSVISEKDEWLYPTKRKDGYASISIKGKTYMLHRLVLANKLNMKYEEIKLACHKFPKNSRYVKDQPSKNNINPDHLYNGNASENSVDTLGYSKVVKVTPEISQKIKKEASNVDFSVIGVISEFDAKIANKYNISISSVARFRAKSNIIRDFDGLKLIKDLVERHGGFCLSTQYKNNQTKLTFKCGIEEHPSWETTAGSIFNGSWCRKCYQENRKDRKPRKEN